MRLLLGWLLLLVGLALPGCARPAEDGHRVRIAYMARLTHAPALTALESGRLAAALPGVKLEPKAFEVGNSIIEALFAGELDFAFLGPNPAINGFVRSGGEIRIIAGAATGGSAFVVRPGAGIAGPGDLHGKKLATPQIASTQDIALRRYLRRRGLSTTLEGGDIAVLPMAGPEIRLGLQRGEIDGAWVSEPLAAQLVASAGAHVLLDEAEEWPDGRYPTTVLAVRTRFQRAHPEIVARVLEAHASEVKFIESHRDEALELSLAAIQRELKTRVPDQVARPAWAHVAFSTDLEPSWLPRLAGDAQAEGFLPPCSLEGLVPGDVSPAAPLAREEPR